MATSQLQLVFDKTYDLRNKIKVIKATYRQLFENSTAWQKLKKEEEDLIGRKKQIIAGLRSEMEGELEQLDGLEIEMRDELQLLSDKALSDYVKGTRVEVVDKKGFICEPLFSVKFKRTDVKKEDMDKAKSVAKRK